MSENLIIVRIKTPAKVLPYYFVRRGKKDILSLHHDRTVERAYARSLREYLELSRRRERYFICRESGSAWLKSTQAGNLKTFGSL